MKDIETVICGYYGFENLGDELLAQVVVSLYGRNNISPDKLAILSSSPDKTATALGITAVNRWNPIRVWKVLRRSRTLILGGGGLFQDSTSLRSSLYYWGVIRMALLAGCRVWMFGQSVGPFRTRRAAFLARDAIGKCRVRVVRDETSMKILEKWGMSCSVVPDPVIALPSHLAGREGKEYVLVNIRPWADGSIPEKVFTEAVGISKRTGLPLKVVAMAPEDEILARHYLLSSEGCDMEVERAANLADILRIWRGAAFAFGMRLHFCIISVLSGVPCLAVPYDPKVDGFCASYGVPVWDMQTTPEVKSLQDRLPQGNLMDEAEKIEIIFARSLKEVGNLP
jgi:polysaccharide pyruvyl transferase CsaB